MDAGAFRTLQALAYEKAGIALAEGKESLVEARIAKRLRALGLCDERAYVELLRKDDGGGELVQFLDAISTNFTSFFREASHFEALARHVAAARAGGQRRFRFWSAASSSGEEPYSMAITLAEAFGAGAPDPDRVDWKILATDLSTRVLAAAQAARYSPAQVAPVPPQLRQRHLREVRDAQGGSFEVCPALREHVAFRRLNLAQPPYPMTGPLDVVFCRNVMIYFDTRVRQGIVREAERLLRPGGLFLIGHTETLNGVKTTFELLEPSVYRQPG